MILFRKLVSTTLSSRTEFYSTVGLEAWSGHGGDRIYKKLQQLLKRLGAGIPGAGEVVGEEMAKISRGKAKTPTPTKAKTGISADQTGTPTPTKKGGKKRKIESEEEQEEEEEEVKEE